MSTCVFTCDFIFMFLEFIKKTRREVTARSYNRAAKWQQTQSSVETRETFYPVTHGLNHVISKSLKTLL